MRQGERQRRDERKKKKQKQRGEIKESRTYLRTWGTREARGSRGTNGTLHREGGREGEGEIEW